MSLPTMRANRPPDYRTLAVAAVIHGGLILWSHELPGIWSTLRPAALQSGRVFSGGYKEVARRYFFRPFITPEHPVSGDRP